MSDKGNDMTSNSAKEEVKAGKKQEVIITSISNSKDSPFYLQEPYVYLINPGLLPKKLSIIKDFPVGRILTQFVQKMKESNDGILDFRILGLVLGQSVKIHLSKINLVIKYQQKEDIKTKRKRVQDEFDASKLLPYWYNRPQMVLASEGQKRMFFEELLSAFEEIENFEIKKKERKRRLIFRRQKKNDDKNKSKKSKRRKLTADAIGNFDYIMNFDLTEVDQLTDEMLDIIKSFLEKGLFRKRKEVSFDEVVKARIKRMSKKQKIDFDRAQLERVRSLLGLLYLIQDQLIEAWQDEDTFEIGIKPLKKAYEVTEGTKQI